MEQITANTEWKDIPGIAEVDFDAHHKKLFDMADEIQNAMHEGSGDAILHEHLADMISFTRAHFIAEEQSMRAHNYRDLDKHKKEHDRLLQQTMDLQNKLQEGGKVFSMDVIYFLRYWIMNHVTNSDTAYDAYLERIEL